MSLEIKKIKSKKSGFSIGEVILSVFILGVVMVVIMSVLSVSMREMMDERDNTIAIMLAQEGVELARNIRDKNWSDRVGLGDTDPKVFDNFKNSDNNSCRIDYLSSDLNTCNGGLTFKLYVSGGFYSHTAGTDTKFRRRILLDYDGSNSNNSTEATITSLVSWNSASVPDNKASCTVQNKCVFSESKITDWGTGI